MKFRSLPTAIGISALAALLLMCASGAVAQGDNPPAPNTQGPGAAASPSNPAALRSRLTYQGRLTSSAGSPVNSPVQMVFTIYDEGGTALWTSATRTVTPANGLFTVYLGANPPDPNIDATTLANAASIGVKVGSDAEMTPRQPISTVVGYSANQYGVVGGSNNGTGVYGASNSGTGVYGDGGSGAGTGVYGVSGNGTGVYGAGSLIGTGVYGTSILGTGVSGSSVSGVGVSGSSDSNAGVYAKSGGGTRDKPAIRADNTQTTNGIAGYFTNNSNYATAQFRNAGNGEVLYLQNGYTGTTASNGGPEGGPFIRAINGPETAELFAVAKNGDVTQMRDANGLVKAGVYALCAGSPVIPLRYRSFPTVNIQQGTSSGHCTLIFPFEVTDRYWVATGGEGIAVSCTPEAANTKLDCVVFDTKTGTGSNSNIMVLVY